MQLFSRPCTLLFCVLYCCCITGCFSSPAADETVAPAKQSTSQDIETNVTTVKAIYKEFDYPIWTYGKVRSMQDQLLTSEAGGKLSLLKVFSGERVNKDDVLAQFETAAVLQKAEHSKLTKFNSEREYESQLLSFENLLKDKSVSEAEDIRKKLRISSGLAGAELELKENIAELAKYTIRAPFSGGNGKEVEIKEGLPRNSSVIVKNNLQLSHDSSVKEILWPGIPSVEKWFYDSIWL
jgi:multidrug efflux pump subunit AcrA (membrane-fusion protein)